MTFSNTFGCWHMNSCRCNKDESPPAKSVNGIDAFVAFFDAVEVEVAVVMVGPLVGASVAGTIGSVLSANPP